MFAIVVPLHLKTIVGQMNIVIIPIKSVVRRRSSKVTIFVIVKFILVINHSPHSNVKLTLLIQQRLLYVLLNDPLMNGALPLNESLNIFECLKYFNSSSLIHISRFN